MSHSAEEPSRLEAISTRWSLLREAHGQSTASRQQARQALVLRYLPAVRRYIRALVKQEDEAEDLAQDVVVRLMAGDFAGADPSRGRFRDFLKVAVRNMVRNYWNRQRRRRTTSLQTAPPIADPQPSDEQFWLTQWRRRLLDLAWNALREQQRRAGSTAYTLLRLRSRYPHETSQQLAVRLSQKLGKPVRADAVRQRLRRARLQFADLVISEIAKGLADPTPERIENELMALGLRKLIRELLPGN